MTFTDEKAAGIEAKVKKSVEDGVKVFALMNGRDEGEMKVSFAGTLGNDSSISVEIADMSGDRMVKCTITLTEDENKVEVNAYDEPEFFHLLRDTLGIRHELMIRSDVVLLEAKGRQLYDQRLTNLIANLLQEEENILMHDSCMKDLAHKYELKVGCTPRNVYPTMPKQTRYLMKILDGIGARVKSKLMKMFQGHLWIDDEPARYVYGECGITYDAYWKESTLDLKGKKFEITVLHAIDGTDVDDDEISIRLEYPEHWDIPWYDVYPVSVFKYDEDNLEKVGYEIIHDYVKKDGVIDKFNKREV